MADLMIYNKRKPIEEPFLEYNKSIPRMKSVSQEVDDIVSASSNQSRFTVANDRDYQGPNPDESVQKTYRKY